MIADGTGRGGERGISEGARRTVEAAERCAARGDVALLAVFILSPENLRRGRRFHTALHAEFLRLVEAVEARRVLEGVRIELYGRLDRLKRKGGAARRLAYVIELLVEATRGVAEPKVRLVLGIDYDGWAPLMLGLDVLIRTGMEASGALRLSGLRAHPGLACVSTMKLWRNFDARDLDEAIARVEHDLPTAFSPGYSADFITSFLREMLDTDVPSPLRVVVPVAASGPALAGALEDLEVGPLGRQTRLAVSLALEPSRPRRRFGARRGATQHVLLVGPACRSRIDAEAPFTAIIAPSQPDPIVRFVDRPLGYANAHVAAPTPTGVVEGLRRAVRFDASHPPRFGAARAAPAYPDDPARRAWTAHIDALQSLLRARPHDSVEKAALELDGGVNGADPGLIADLFVARELDGAMAAGLLSRDAHWARQAVGYALTAFGITFRQPSASDVRGEQWERVARPLARIMLVLASSDEEMSDRVFSERDEEQRARLQGAMRYILEAIRGAPERPAPDVRGAASVAAIARAWREFFTCYGAAAHPTVIASVREAAEALYAANLNELSPEVVDEPLLRRFERHRSRRTAAAIELRYAAAAPAPVARRIRGLLAAAERDPASGDELRELRLLCYLGPIAPGIGAGLALRSMAATEQAHAITDEAAAALARVTQLIDYYFRIANDLAFLDDAISGDRDRKRNAWTVLVPGHLLGRLRERAVVDALGTCRRVAAWIHDELQRELVDLEGRSPHHANWLRRAVAIGKEVYEASHYERLCRDAMLAILGRIEQR
ncbi:hypothetical protein [Sorangium cellulosum]|uniref:hypothetical protein n=1 Tax=Sorangium cellulosum TaxID=56 RepID=UPI0005D1E1FA|nr:hypothetical protein [Sorangium cellulosum]